jgi:hypothetical protein
MVNNLHTWAVFITKYRSDEVNSIHGKKELDVDEIVSRQPPRQSVRKSVRNS